MAAHVPATDAQRSKASRIRRRIREGKATADDRAWLARYERRHGGPRTEGTDPPAAARADVSGSDTPRAPEPPAPEPAESAEDRRRRIRELELGAGPDTAQPPEDVTDADGRRHVRRDTDDGPVYDDEWAEPRDDDDDGPAGAGTRDDGPSERVGHDPGCPRGDERVVCGTCEKKYRPLGQSKREIEEQAGLEAEELIKLMVMAERVGRGVPVSEAMELPDLTPELRRRLGRKTWRIAARFGGGGGFFTAVGSALNGLGSIGGTYAESIRQRDAERGYTGSWKARYAEAARQAQAQAKAQASASERR